MGVNGEKMMKGIQNAEQEGTQILTAQGPVGGSVWQENREDLTVDGGKRDSRRAQKSAPLR